VSLASLYSRLGPVDGANRGGRAEDLLGVDPHVRHDAGEHCGRDDAALGSAPPTRSVAPFSTVSWIWAYCRSAAAWFACDPTTVPVYWKPFYYLLEDPVSN